RRCGVVLAPAVFAASLHERLMNPIENAIARPFPEVIIDRAMWRKILWQLPPLATRAIEIANGVECVAHVCVALTSARASRRDQDNVHPAACASRDVFSSTWQPPPSPNRLP